MSLIIYAIPVFFLLIGIELLISKMKRLSYYRMNDSISNLSCGIGSQISGIFLKTVTFIGYKYLYEHSVWKIENTVLAGLLLFVGVDFFYYWFHRLAHEISFLWGSHVVHHQSEEYNLTVALRQAWLQGAFSWIFYLPLAFAGFSPAMFLTIASLQTLYQFWIHTKLIGKMNPVFEYVFNTPSHHRVHHGVNPQYIDRNHGGTLIIFDRMFGTFEPENEEVVYGITKATNSWNPVWVNFEYWIGLFNDVFKVHQIKNAVLMLIKMPGWKPAELGGTQMPKPVSPQTFHKYNTEISPGLTNYAFVQFIVILLGTTVFLVLESKNPFNQNVALRIFTAGLIVVSLVSIGGMFERRSWVLVLEYVRMAALIVLTMLLFQNSALFIFAVSIMAMIALVSLIWFTKFRNEMRIKSPDYAPSPNF